MIEKILLDDHARMKLSVYGKVMTLRPGEYSLDHVRENLDFYFSATRFKKILCDIQDDLEQFTDIKLLHNKISYPFLNNLFNISNTNITYQQKVFLINY